MNPRKRIMEMFAFCAKYGHQQLVHMKRTPMRELSEFADEVGEIMRTEREQFNGMFPGGLE